jgi:AcrR family transcriptional regulator
MSDSEPAVRPPKQRRSRESYERVLEAATRLLAEKGFEGFTVQDVAAQAKVSIGAIYERFGSKEALLRAVHSLMMEEIAREESIYDTAQPEAADVGAVIALWVRRIAATMDAHRGLMRPFMHLGALDAVIAARGSEASVRLSHRFKAALLPYASEFRHLQPEVALDVAFRLTYSTLARQVMYGPVFESDVELTWEQLLVELTGACHAYLIGL